MDGTAYQGIGTVEMEVGADDAALPDFRRPLVALPIALPIPSGPMARLAHPLSLACAAALHLAVLALLMPSTTDAIGDGGEALAAVAVAIVDRIPQAAPPTTGAPDRVVDPVQAEEPHTETPPLAKPESPPPDAAQPELTLPPELELQPEAPTLPARLPDAEKLPEKLREKPEEPPVRKAEEQTAAATPAQPTASMVAVAAVEASPGVVKAYESALTKVIAARPPRNRGVKGRLVVELVIGHNGRAEVVRIVETSGRRALDDLVVTALQKLEFPTPPAAMTPRQRTFHQAFVYN